MKLIISSLCLVFLFIHSSLADDNSYAAPEHTEEKQVFEPDNWTRHFMYPPGERKLHGFSEDKPHGDHHDAEPPHGGEPEGVGESEAAH